MASLDGDSRFTNVLLDETVKIYIDELFKSEITAFGLNKKAMFEILQLTLKEPIIRFHKNITFKLTELPWVLL